MFNTLRRRLAVTFTRQQLVQQFPPRQVIPVAVSLAVEDAPSSTPRQRMDLARYLRNELVVEEDHP